MGDFPSSVTFEYVKERTASDLRQVADYLLSAAEAVEAGDLGAGEDLIFGETNSLPAWNEMLAIRFAYLQERLAEDRERAAGGSR